MNLFGATLKDAIDSLWTNQIDFEQSRAYFALDWAHRLSGFDLVCLLAAWRGKNQTRVRRLQKVVRQKWLPERISFAQSRVMFYKSKLMVSDGKVKQIPRS